MKKTAAADMVIFGGGIAGLWVLNRLRQLGFSVLLFESNALGSGQTHKSQGIIHGGLKYALQGKLNKEVEALTHMPEIWRQCLSGVGEIDLSQVTVLSNEQYLFAEGQLKAKLSGFLASTALSSRVRPLSREKFPSLFQHSAFKGDVFSLDEIVIDVTTLIRELVKANQDAIFMIEPLSGEGLKFDDQGKLISATIYMSGKFVEVSAQQFIFTAGIGNEVVLKRLKTKEVAMQRRPLHMVLVKTPFDYPIYAHCVGLGRKPRLTITTHRTFNGETVWYLGGSLAEEGVKRDACAQMKAAQTELRSLFPWLDFSRAAFSTFIVDRAEPLQKGFLKPESAYTKMIENMIIAWPTKLALAPKLAENILQHVSKLELTPHLFDTRELRAWPIPPLASPIWEDAFCKNES
jgi:glycerol-3-phosphate dehydrogenase